MSELRALDGGAEGTPERFVGRDEMARILGVSTRTLDRMVAKGEIPSTTFGRRTRRFRASVVIARAAQLDAGQNKGEAA